jgi:hypothetical protein
MNKGFVCSTLCAVGLVHAGCSSQAAGDPVEETGSIQFALTAADPILDPTLGVASIHYIVVNNGQSCTSPPVAEKTVPLEPNSLPPNLLPDGGGSMHPFADALFVLAPGTYTVCALPLNQFGGPSSKCEADIRSVTVFAGATSEQVLVAQCRTPDNGSIDAITILNRNPVITDLTITPSKFIQRCPGQGARLSAKAFDPDGDSLTFTWTSLSSGSTATAPVVTFFPPSVGDFQIRLLVRDGRFNGNGVQGVAQLTFPIHVSPCADAGAEASPTAQSVLPAPEFRP